MNPNINARAEAESTSLTAPRQLSYAARTPELPFAPDHTFAYSPREELTRGYFGNPGEDFSEPTTPASNREQTNFNSVEFLPSVNFDEFQTSLSTLDTNTTFSPNFHKSAQPVQPARIPLVDASTNGKKKTTTEPKRSNSIGRRMTLSRGNSFRDRGEHKPRLPSETKGILTPSTTAPFGPGPIARATAAFKARRQSTAAALSASESAKVKKEPKPSKSAFGVTAASHAHSASTSGVQHADLSTVHADVALSNAAKSRRITMSNFGLDHGTSLTSNDTRNMKGKSLLPPAADSDPNTPTGKLNGKPGAQIHTPSSSGGNNNRRQSIASGRLSGLGARTISPTDTRRQKRLSMAPQQPPMPQSSGKGSYASTEDTPSEQQQQQQKMNKFSDLPRLTAVPTISSLPSRDTSSSLASDSAHYSPTESAAASKFGFPYTTSSTIGPGGLSAKSSYTSLYAAASASNSNLQSRVPVPRSRTAASSTTAGSSGDDSQASTEMIPPVPAIPKAYDSPKEAEPLPFGQLGPSSKNSKTNYPYSTANDPFVPTSMTTSSAFSDSDRNRNLAKRLSMAAAYDLDSHARPAPLSSNSTGALETSASFAGFPMPSNDSGRQNGNLQPLRLPPLNLNALTLPGRPARADKNDPGPRPSQELDDRYQTHLINGKQTPDWPRYGHKTPSTPMTASKATFLHRAGESDNVQGRAMRSSTSHFALRGAVGHDPATLRTGWLDDSGDEAHPQGVPIAPSRQNFSRATAVSRNAITPFASGSLPKGSGEFVRFQGRPSGDYGDDLFLPHTASHESASQPKPKIKASRPSMGSLGDSILSVQSHVDSEQSPLTGEAPEKDLPSGKKESTGLRRKLSLGWRRSSSKTANHADNAKTGDGDTPRSAKDISHTSTMLPPKLPSSMAFTGDGSLGMSLIARPSLDGGETASLSDRLRKRTILAGKPAAAVDQDSSTSKQKADNSAPKTRSLHSERPQPVSNTRSSSWSSANRVSMLNKSQMPHPKSRHSHSASTINALIKDDDDLAADDEMRRMTQKKKDVDNVAIMTDELLRRASPKSPMSIDEVLHDRHCSLNIFERGEVIEYENEGIFFTGAKQAKKIVGALHPSSQPTELKGSDKSGKSGNYGYDDERGDYNIIIGDHLAYRYEVCDVLGKGSFGQVVRCIDHKEGGVVAVKIIRNKKRFHQQALVEVGILGKLREWVSLLAICVNLYTDFDAQDPDGAHATLSITGSFYFRSHLCIVTPCLSINLYELIRAHNFSGFSLRLIRRFARQLLACLVLLQEKSVIHCDLKPENILLCSARAADVRVIDFGSSCREEEKVYTYIQSRFYRSPEVILGSSYGLGIDMWSFGCILAELWTGYPIFPGENEQEQLACIMEIFGPPDRHLVERCTRKKLFFDSVGKPRVTVSSKGRRRRPSSKTLQQALKTEDEAFIDFIARCLRWDPERRLKPHEACSHAFIANQPLHYRPGIPDEARRSARVRSAAAMPVSNPAVSPVKRAQPQQATVVSAAQTPYKAAARQLPSTPQTALRASNTATTNTQASPAKTTASRRQSNIASAGGIAAIRRQSNGAALSSNFVLPASKTAANLGSLAEKAARESMAATGTTTATAGSLTSNSSGRWRM